MRELIHKLLDTIDLHVMGYSAEELMGEDLFMGNKGEVLTGRSWGRGQGILCKVGIEYNLYSYKICPHVRHCDHSHNL